MLRAFVCHLGFLFGTLGFVWITSGSVLVPSNGGYHGWGLRRVLDKVLGRVYVPKAENGGGEAATIGGGRAWGAQHHHKGYLFFGFLLRLL